MFELNQMLLALILFADYLYGLGFHMIDCQFRTEHLASMGGETISYEEYMKLLRKT